MKSVLFVFVIVLLSLIGNTAYSCSFDMDCGAGKKCVKQPNTVVGKCTPKKILPKGCQFKGDCETGWTCEKGPNASRGECVLVYPKRSKRKCSFDMDCGAGHKCIIKVGEVNGYCN